MEKTSIIMMADNEGIIEDEDGELDDRLEEFFDGLNTH